MNKLARKFFKLLAKQPTCAAPPTMSWLKVTSVMSLRNLFVLKGALVPGWILYLDIVGSSPSCNRNKMMIDINYDNIYNSLHNNW